MNNNGGLSKTDQAYQRLKESIQKGLFSPGTRLTEAEVIRTLSLPRGPVRESMARLQGEGLLTVRGAGRGKVVEFMEGHKPQEILSRYELREAVEGLAARLAAKNMNGWEIDKLRKLQEKMAEYHAAKDREARNEAGKEFDLFLVNHCGNPLVAKAWLMLDLSALPPRSSELEDRIRSHFPGGGVSGKTDLKLDLVEAIAAHDADLAEQTARGSVSRVTEAIRRTVLEKKGVL